MLVMPTVTASLVWMAWHLRSEIVLRASAFGHLNHTAILELEQCQTINRILLGVEPTFLHRRHGHADERTPQADAIITDGLGLGLCALRRSICLAAKLSEGAQVLVVAWILHLFRIFNLSEHHNDIIRVVFYELHRFASGLRLGNELGPKDHDQASPLVSVLGILDEIL